jgi:hypothetical protein
VKEAAGIEIASGFLFILQSVIEVHPGIQNSPD